MRKIVLPVVYAFLLCVNVVVASAQALISTTPAFLKEVNSTPVTITLNATKGNQALQGYTPTNDVYLHLGVITNLSTGPTDWKYVMTTWGSTSPTYSATYQGNNQWSYNLPANLRSFFNITNPAEKIIRIAILFRNGAGTVVHRCGPGAPHNGDMYIPVDTTNNLQVKFTAPPTEPRYTPWAEPVNVTIGQQLPVTVNTSANATINLELNGVNIGSGSAINVLSANPTINQGCTNVLKVTASDATSTVVDSLSFFVNGSSGSIAPLPAGVRDGINYHPGDTSVTLVLYAPGKLNVLVNGSFSNWQSNCNYVMKRTPDTLRHWITINGLTPGQIYTFQYLVDGSIITTDPYCELILDPSNDPYISSNTYPNLPPYPVGQSGIVGTFQPGAPQYTWTTTNYTRPDKRNLVIYEILLRDFLSTQNWKTLTDTLPYLKNLGINCIELMPFTEFEGNNSWGYNPFFFFAPDKNYGTKNDLKKFIDKAHSMGMAVVLDAVFNQVTGLSPLAQLYWNSATNKPLPSNPWLNVDATHPFNVFNDFNHESQATKYHVRRFMQHWLQEYKLDGFRWDLAKGFTQVNSGGNVAAWNAYDASRVAIWKDYYDTMMSYSPGTYCILEFLGVDQEESEYANYGMLLWGKMTDEYTKCVQGFNGNLDRAYHKNRFGFNKPGLIAYAESHDEERVVYATTQYGNNSNPSHNTRQLSVAIPRMSAMHAMLLLIPGPKMIWQFGELGYDYGINYCPTSNTYNSNCRLEPKPIKWNYFTEVNRKKVYQVVSRLNQLRELEPELFVNETVTLGTNFGSSVQKKIVLDHSSLKLSAASNFDVTTQTVQLSFPTNGWYYNYFGSDSINVTNNTFSQNIGAGGFVVYTNKNFGASNINVGLDEIIERGNDLIAVAPNPFTTGTHLYLDLASERKLDINIINLQGQVVAQIAKGKNFIGYHEINLAEYLATVPSGMYMVNITGTSGSVVNVKITKN